MLGLSGAQWQWNQQPFHDARKVTASPQPSAGGSVPSYMKPTGNISQRICKPSTARPTAHTSSWGSAGRFPTPKLASQQYVPAEPAVRFAGNRHLIPPVPPLPCVRCVSPVGRARAAVLLTSTRAGKKASPPKKKKPPRRLPPPLPTPTPDPEPELAEGAELTLEPARRGSWTEEDEPAELTIEPAPEPLAEAPPPPACAPEPALAPEPAPSVPPRKDLTPPPKPPRKPTAAPIQGRVVAKPGRGTPPGGWSKPSSVKLLGQPSTPATPPATASAIPVRKASTVISARASVRAHADQCLGLWVLDGGSSVISEHRSMLPVFGYEAGLGMGAVSQISGAALSSVPTLARRQLASKCRRA